MHKTTKKMIEHSILFAIESLRNDICGSSCASDNKIRADAIKALAESYNIVHRGNGDDF